MLSGAERVAPILRRSVNDRTPLHVNAIRQLLIALNAPRIGMTGANYCLALWALADYRRRLFRGCTSRRCVHNANPQTLLNQIDANSSTGKDAPYIIPGDSVQVPL